jgi:lipoprotein-anchoring transpeptidase ErfK/SrfK
MSLAPVYQHIVITRPKFKLEFWQRPKSAAFRHIDYRITHRYDIAVGAEGHKTEPGLYMVWSKDDTPQWTMPNEDWVPEDMRLKTLPFGDPNNPIKGAWIGFNPNEAEGMHGTADIDSIGTRASHGCVRMRVPDVLELFEMVKKGCPVYVI